MAVGPGRILDNGDFLVEETHGGRLLYFNKDGSLRWSYLNRADDGNIYNLENSFQLDLVKEVISTNKTNIIDTDNNKTEKPVNILFNTPLVKLGRMMCILDFKYDSKIVLNVNKNKIKNIISK